MADKKTIDSYNKIAEEFSLRNSVTIYGEKYQDFKNFISGNKVLDIGCGSGRDGVELIKLGFDHTGLDASESMIYAAKQRIKDGKFVLGDFFSLSFPDESFDGFWAAASFLHVPKKDIDLVLREAKRILKKNGIGFISLKKKLNLDEGVIKESKAGGIERYFSFYEEEEFRKILERNRFEVLKVTHQIENDEIKTNWLCYFVRKN